MAEEITLTVPDGTTDWLRTVGTLLKMGENPEEVAKRFRHPQPARDGLGSRPEFTLAGASLERSHDRRAAGRLNRDQARASYACDAGKTGLPRETVDVARIPFASAALGRDPDSCRGLLILIPRMAQLLPENPT